MKCVIVGYGRIGRELKIQAESVGYQVVAYTTSKRITMYTGHSEDFEVPGDPTSIRAKLVPFCKKEDVQLAFFAIPSGGDGSDELNLMRPFLTNRIPVVTAGKAAMANQFNALENDIHLIGCDASVGGGTGFLPTLDQCIIANDRSPITIKGVLNGTMNYILSGIWEGRPMHAVLREAIDLGYAEPFAEGQKPDALTVFRDEIGDVTKKVAITVNRGLRQSIGFSILPNDIRATDLTEKALMRYAQENARMKYVVQISTEDFTPIVDEKAPGSISLHQAALHIVGGFCHVPAGSPLDGWLPHGVGNAFKISQGGGEILLSGEGAGPRATARRMVLNANRLAPAAQKVVPLRKQA